MAPKPIKPAFILVAVCTIDGRIARTPHHMTDWSSREDKDHLHGQLDASDAVIVGRNTFEVAGTPLSNRNCIVFTHSSSGVEQRGPRLVYLDPAKTDVMEFCAACGYRKVAVLGGTKTFSYFLEKGLVDEIFLTIEPLVFGKGLGLFVAESVDIRFKLVSVKKLNRSGTVLLHYKNRVAK